MNHYRPARRSYNEKELRALIQRATELHEEASGGSERSLSLEEIEHIASELGLPPEYMRTAALELENRDNSDNKFSLWGAPFIIDQTRVVEGTMTEEQWQHIVLELRRFSGRTGKASEVGSAREWTHALGESDEGISFTRTQVTLRPEQGQTSIQIRKRYGGIAVAAYLGTFFFSTLLTIFTIEAFDGMGLPDLVNFAILGGVVFGALAVVRGSISLWARRQKERLKRLTNLLHQTFSASLSEDLSVEPTAELIELPEVDDADRIIAETRRGTRV